MNNWRANAGVQWLIGASFVVVTAVTVGAGVAERNAVRFAVAGVVAFTLAAFASRLNVGVVLGVLVIWLTALGLIRRLVSTVSPEDAWGDPLLLVGAGVWALLMFRAVRGGALRNQTHLTKAVLALLGLLSVSALNPLQGRVSVGLSGALLVVVPMTAFLVGRTLVDDRLFGRLLWLVAGLGIVVAMYGLAQTSSGFPSWDQSWIDTNGYAALNVGGVTRAFGSFSAASEYAGFLGLAIVAWLARGRGIVRWPLLAAAVGLIATALWYEAVRSATVLTIAAVAAMVAARAGFSPPRAVVAGLLLLAALPTLVGSLAPADLGDDPRGQLAAHQVQGLADPFGETSTLPLHASLVWTGIEHAFTDPIGIGVGSITRAGVKYGGAVSGGEADPARVPFAAGLPGLVAYIAVVAFGVTRAYRLATIRRDAVSLAALGIVVVTFLQWLNGGHYAVAFWAWLALGWVDGLYPSSTTNPERWQESPLLRHERSR